MADELIERWKIFNLIEDEENEIDLHEMPDGEMATQVELTLVGARIIDQSPWSFDNHLLLLREISGIEQLRDLSFDTVYFWIKIYNVPFVKRSRALASLVGNKLGQFFDYDESDISGWSKYMRVRVWFTVDKPLPRGTVMKVGGERIWVDIKIERLPGFCYCCWCLRHVLRECSDYDEEVPEAELPYSTWLRASPIKNRGRGGGADREAE
ncbi:Arginine biosynthesis bifunctional protein ArgJ mitochondrial [Bienertia sinuspersici]